MKNKKLDVVITRRLVDDIKYEIDAMRAHAEDDDCDFDDDELASALNDVVRAYFKDYLNAHMTDGDCTLIILWVDAYYDCELTLEDCMDKFNELIKEYTGE